MSKCINGKSQNKVIVALDFSTEERTLDFLKAFHEPAYVKIGMELVYSAGFDVVKKVKALGHDVFLDLKLQDIPNTVYGAMKGLSKLGVDMVNLYSAGGKEMMKAAMAGLDEGCSFGKRPLCIAVTMLTSITEEMMKKELIIDGKLEDVVLHYGYNAREAGLDGVVCSVHESKIIHQNLGETFLTVTPAIRLPENKSDDQKRIATPQLARAAGCNYIVVGRAITESSTPVATYRKIKNLFEGGN